MEWRMDKLSSDDKRSEEIYKWIYKDKRTVNFEIQIEKAFVCIMMDHELYFCFKFSVITITDILQALSDFADCRL